MINNNLIFLIYFCFAATAYADTPEYYDRTTETKKIDIMLKGMDAVKARIKNSESAQFKNVLLHRGSNNIQMICGEVNSKDGYDNYSGFQRFISAGRTDLTLLEDKNTDLSEIWNKFCHDK